LGVAVINLEDVFQLMEDGILPSPKDLACYSAGLVRNLVLAGQHALVEFRRPHGRGGGPAEGRPLRRAAVPAEY
jgi:hypothetical protein